MMEYHAPQELGEALALLSRGGVRPVAGGTDLYPAQGERPFRHDLLDLTGIGTLRGISRQEGGWRIGAATRWSDVARADLPRAFDGLRAAAREVGSIQIQNAGTVGGNIVNASPAADGVPPLLTLGAEVELASLAGARHVPLEEFLKGPRQVDLAPGEMVVALHMPAPPEAARGGWAKLGSRAYLVISIAMVAVLLELDGEGRIAMARVAVGACSPVARRLGALEAELVGKRPEEVEVSAAHLDVLAPLDDVRGSAAYRRGAVAELVARAIRECGDG